MTTDQSTDGLELVERLEVSKPIAIDDEVPSSLHTNDSNSEASPDAASGQHTSTSDEPAGDREQGDLIAQERDQWAAAVDAAERQILRLTEKAAELERPLG